MLLAIPILILDRQTHWRGEDVGLTGSLRSVPSSPSACWQGKLLAESFQLVTLRAYDFTHLLKRPKIYFRRWKIFHRPKLSRVEELNVNEIKNLSTPTTYSSVNIISTWRSLRTVLFSQFSRNVPILVCNRKMLLLFGGGGIWHWRHLFLVIFDWIWARVAVRSCHYIGYTVIESSDSFTRRSCSAPAVWRWQLWLKL